MEMRALASIHPVADLTAVLRDRRWGAETRLFVALAIAGVLAVMAGAYAGATVGYPIALVVLGLLVLASLLLRWPILGFYIVAAAAVMVDEQGTLYVFSWPPALEGFIERPIGLLVLFVLAVLVLRRFATRQRLIEVGDLIVPYLIFIGLVAFGFLHGLASGGDLKTAVVAVRPLWYLFISYVLAYNLVTRKEHVRAFIWIAVLGIGFRALQGLYLFIFTYHPQVSTDASLMPHEESFFFASFLALVVLQIMHARHGKLFAAGVVLSPIVLVTMVANDRRTDYIALVLAAVAIWVLVMAVRPEVRARLLLIGLCIAGLGIGYVAAFGSSDSTAPVGAPARAIVSVFQPTGDKADSNQYRQMEDVDTQYTAAQSPLLGLGFGKPFLQPEPLTDIFPQIQQVDQYYNYVPHNNIYWILFSLGLAGYFALWYLFGSMIVRGCLIAKQLRDPYLRTVAIFAVGVFCMEIVVAYADYQLFTYRNVFFVGLLAGVLMRLPQFDRSPDPSAPSIDEERRGGTEHLARVGASSLSASHVARGGTRSIRGTITTAVACVSVVGPMSMAWIGCVGQAIVHLIRERAGPRVEARTGGGDVCYS